MWCDLYYGQNACTLTDISFYPLMKLHIFCEYNKDYKEQGYNDNSPKAVL